MDTLDLYGIVAFALICLVFYGIHRIPLYAAACVLVTAGFVWWSWPLFDLHKPGEWLVMTLGLLLFSFGLLIVRVMLIRSVSLQLLGRLSRGEPAEGMVEDIGARLKDMEYFHLIRRGETNRLTGFGWFCSTVVVIFYAIFRIK